MTTIPRWLRASTVVAAGLMLSLIAWWPILRGAPATQGGDGQVFHKMLEAARVTVVRYREFPFWNPFECGGLPLWDNPQAPIGAPLIWMMLLVGTTAAMAWWYILHSAIGFVCMWIFARRELALSIGAAFVASTAWAFAGFHQQHYGGGHLAFVPFLYFPLAIHLWRRAEHDVRYAIGLGALVALMIHEGGVYPLPHLAALLGVETAMRIRRRSALAIARAGAIVVVVGLSLGAARFLPVLDQLRAHRRSLTAETDALQWQTLKDVFVARTHSFQVIGQAYVWPEYGSYLGPIVLLLAVVGIVLAGTERLYLLVLLLFSFALMAGHAGKYAPWSLLKAHVFPFKEMRVPSRFVASVSLFLAAYAGLAVDLVHQRLRRVNVPFEWSDAARSVVLAVGLIGAGDVLGTAAFRSEEAFTGPAEQKVEPAAQLHLGPDTGAMIDQPRRNVGRMFCWEEWGFGAGAPLWLGDVPQARATSGAAVVENVRRTPNTFVFTVTAPEPARISLNSTYDAGWRANVGAVADLEKQLVVDVPAGTHQVVVRYRPRTFALGVVIASVSAAAIVGFFVWDARRRRSAG